MAAAAVAQQAGDAGYAAPAGIVEDAAELQAEYRSFLDSVWRRGRVSYECFCVSCSHPYTT